MFLLREGNSKILTKQDLQFARAPGYQVNTDRGLGKENIMKRLGWAAPTDVRISQV